MCGGLTTRALAAIAISVISLCYLLGMATSAMWFGINASSQTCEMLYIVCAAFWLVGKSMLYLWYSEKVVVLLLPLPGGTWR